MTNHQSLKDKKTNIKTYLDKFEDFCELYLVKKAPFQIPDNIKEYIVRFGPWLILVFLVMSVPAIFSFFKAVTFVAPSYSYWANPYSFSFSIFFVLSLISMALEAIAIKGLLARQLKAWYLVLYASLLSCLLSLLTFNLAGLLIGGVISLYLLYQIKDCYK